MGQRVRAVQRLTDQSSVWLCDQIEGEMKNYRKFTVWQKAYGLTLDLYRVTKQFPLDERFGLTSQIRRAAVSIPSNFAEGMSRRSDRDKARFLYIALGSANELEVQTELSFDLAYMGNMQFKQLIADLREVRRMLVGLIKALERTQLPAVR